MTIKIIVLVPSGRRKNTNVSPNSVISQTLEEICKRENLDSEKYSFQFQRKILDESLSWRFANIPNNAKLELIEREKNKTETPVRIAMQFENERFQFSFLPSTTLWEILGHWGSELPFLKPPNGHEPSILYVRQEITGRHNLQAKTLKNLGLTKGSAVLKFSFRPQSTDAVSDASETSLQMKDSKTVSEITKTPESISASSLEQKSSDGSTNKLLTQEMLKSALDSVFSGSAANSAMDITVAADGQVTDSKDKIMEEIDQVAENSDQIQEEEMEQELTTNVQTTKIKQERSRARRNVSKESIPPKKFKPTPPASPESDFSEFKFPKATEGQDLYMTETDVESELALSSQPCDREACFYDETQIRLDDNNTEEPGDEFFELTIEDLQKMLADLRYQQKESEEKSLMTSRSREIQKLRAINQYPKIVVRIIFPDRKILQGIFRPAETVEALYNFVKTYLTDVKTDFYLYTTPPKVILKDRKAILYDYHLSPASKVYVSFKEREFDSSQLSEKCFEVKSSPYEADLKLREILSMRTEWDGQEDNSTDSRPSRQPLISANGESSSSSQSSSSGATRERSSNNNTGARPKVPKWFKLGKK